MVIPLPPKFRFALYVIGVLVFAVVTGLSFFKVIDPGVASTVNAQLVSILGLFGITIAGTAAYNTNKQVKDGTFEPTPELDPVDAVVNGINAVLAARQKAEVEVDRVKEAVTQAVSETPVVGPLAKQVLDQIIK